MRKKGKPELPPLCMAVKRVRESYGDTLQRFAQRAGISMDSVSRFERGRVPKNPAVLMKLAVVAQAKGLAAEADQFHMAADEAERSRRVDEIYRPLISPSTVRSLGLAGSPPRVWRLMVAVRIAALYYPESVSALEKTMEQASGPVLALVDRVLQDPQNGALDYIELEYKINQLAEQQSLSKLRQPKEE